ncbi:winged helix-turn-helix domain-containing tetratricopeptide repeat protein [Bradyrhizobium sp. STM 3557]|uniref:winged helix-turn-helix domain-containing tetratricopeptide repeat protein n=1 Tax=Bradyrhizobium sp. STM 3557 TaxID=578920 RepID=UPI00388E6BA6
MQFLFADHALDLDRRELRRDSQAIAVGPLVFDLLAYLIEHRGRVVSKDDLFDHVWRGRIVSESTLTSHINAARKAIGDSGQDQRLIRTVTRKGFRFVADVTEVASLEETARLEAASAHPQPVDAPGLPDKPSIAVLPFDNLSRDGEQDYFADGVVEDIITALSRVRWLFVIARNSSFVFRGRAIDIREIGRALGVRYVVEGSVRRALNRVLVTAQLIDATTGAHLWAERFESALDDIFELQGQVAASIAGAVAPQLELAEIERAKGKPTTSLSAYDCYLRGVAHLHQGSRPAISEAITLFRAAIERDERFGAAHAMAAWCYFWRKVSGWMEDREQESAEGIRLARRGAEYGRDDAVALARSGHALLHLAGEIDAGIALIDRALVLNPNLAFSWALSAYARMWDGDIDGALTRFAQAMRLSPLDPEMYRMKAGIAAAHMFAGRYDLASSWAEESFLHMPSFLLVLAVIAASHALAGRQIRARQAVARVRELDPNMRISNLSDYLVIRSPEHQAIFMDGLRKAGLPE